MYQLPAWYVNSVFPQVPQSMEGRGGQSHSHWPNCESLVYSLSYSFDGIQGITLEASSYVALIPWPNRM